MEDQRNIILTDENGVELEFEIIDLMEIEEEVYAILLPTAEGEENDEAIILKVGQNEKGEDILFEIEDDEEWEMVAKTWWEAVEGEEEE